MDDLRKEFEELMKKDEEACADGSCETQREEEEYPDYVIELTTKMLVPERCGIYFSKKDFREMGLASELSISLKQRVRMVTDLLKSIFTYEDMEKIFAIITILVDNRIATYKELSETFPHSKSYFDTHITKAEKLKADLQRILSENRE
jgi:hypothetical protein